MQIPASPAVVECRGVTVVKGAGPVLADVDWQVRSGQRWVVIGPNGAGKSTLLDVVAARAHPTRGEVRLLGEQLGLVDVFALRTRIGLVGSGVAASIPAGEQVLAAVLTAAYGMTGHWREAYEAPDVARAEALLDRMGIAGLAGRRFGTLSDGERKRVLVARALMPDPELLILDEPAAGLDLGAREALVGMLGRLAGDPASPAIVLVTHHLEEVPSDFTHGMLMRDGRVLAQGPIGEVLTGAGLAAAFGLPMTVGRFAGRYFAVATARSSGRA